MSQHDFSIANQTAGNARTDINNALQALASLSSGTAAPSTTYANMLWYETDTNLLKMRNEANNAWLNIGYIDQSGGFRPLDNTPVVSTAGSQTGILGDQSTATWQTGTGTTDSLVSPADVRAAIDSRVTTSRVGSLTGGLTSTSVGSYIFASRGADQSANYIGPDTTISGSLLYYGNRTGEVGPNVGVGTWRQMGVASNYDRSTVWLRIS